VGALGAFLPPYFKLPHVVIEPSALRAAKARSFASGKQGRYVRIQLLDKNYLSLAEVQVMGVDPLRFAEVDYSSAE
jgi:hypothetical protein